MRIMMLAKKWVSQLKLYLLVIVAVSDGHLYFHLMTAAIWLSATDIEH